MFHKGVIVEFRLHSRPDHLKSQATMGAKSKGLMQERCGLELTVTWKLVKEIETA